MADPFDLDAVYAEERAEPFLFRWAGREWELPHLNDADIEVINEIEGATSFGVDEIVNLFPRMLPPGQRDAWREVQKPTLMLTRLFEQWLAHSGASAGESSGSGDSSPSTEPKSKQTSTGSTASGSGRRSPRGAKKTATARVSSSAV